MQLDSEMVELFRELVGWWSWFQAVTHERWMRPLVRITPPSCAEPMCEAGSAHHPTLGLEGSVRSVDLRSVLFIYKYSVLGIRSEQVDGDNHYYAPSLLDSSISSVAPDTPFAA